MIHTPRHCRLLLNIPTYCHWLMAPEDSFQRELFRRELDAEPSAERLREMALELYDLWQRQRTVTTQLVRQELGQA